MLDIISILNSILDIPFISFLFLIGASVTYSFTNGSVASATEVNQNFTDLVDEFNATIGHDHDGTDSKKIATLGTETANGSGTVTISSLAPAAITVATISKWCLIDVGGVNYYIPLWK